MLDLSITKDVKKFFKTLDPKIHKQIANKIFALMEDPNPSDSKQMKGCSLKRTDIGEFSIVYEQEGNILKIFIIGKRNDDEVYRRVKRKL